jgi:hypothetical protein
MDVTIGKAEFTTPTLTQHAPSAEFKMRAALERIREIIGGGWVNDDQTNRIRLEITKVIDAALEQK